MSFIGRVIVGVTISDSDQWLPETMAAAEGCDDYQDWAIEGLRQALQVAATRYQDEHADVIRFVEAS